MLFLLEEGQNFLLGGANSLIANPVKKVRNTQYLVRAEFSDGLLELALRLLNDVVCPLNGGKCN